jgi:hypothetical protein
MLAKTVIQLQKSAPALIIAVTCALAATPALATDKPLSRDDIAWLQRVGFGIDSVELSDYRKLGRVRFLDEQLADHVGDTLPPDIAAMIKSYEAINTPLTELAAQFRDSRQSIQAMPDGDAKIAAKKALRVHGRELAMEAQQTELLRAIYGTDQLKEQMVWFWLNHFSVYAAKGGVHVARRLRGKCDTPARAGQVPRPGDGHAGKPGHAAVSRQREKRQRQDQRKLRARTDGAAHAGRRLGLLAAGRAAAGADPHRCGHWHSARGMACDGGFFHACSRPAWFATACSSSIPTSTISATRFFLAIASRAAGYDEIAQAVDLIVQQPACATFVSQQIAQYFVADKPPQPWSMRWQRLSSAPMAISPPCCARCFYQRTHCRVSYSNEPKKFKDPTQFLVSAMRLAYDGQPITNAQPLVNWLNQMGEPVFGRITPDGWPLDGSSWSAPARWPNAFDVARMIGSGRNRLFASGDGRRCTSIRRR